MTRIRFALVAFVISCGSPSDDAGDDVGSQGSGSDAASQISLVGRVTNPTNTVQRGRMIVGLARHQSLGPPIACSGFVVHDDQQDVVLPAFYALEHVPLGQYVLVALLVDGTSSDAPFAGYAVDVQADGVHYNSTIAASSIDLVMQGATSYVCP